jgi:hypothetical protein
LKLVSDNKTYEPYWVETADILEVWKAKALSVHNCQSLRQSNNGNADEYDGADAENN